MRRFYVLLFSVGICLQIFAQHSIQSSVFDSKNGLGIEMATVRLLNVKDSSLVQGTQTDSKGGFSLSKIKNGDYILLITSVGYNQQKRNITLDGRDLILKNFQLSENVKLLKEVDVKGRAAQVVVKGDTLEYNATAFKTQENAVVEDLLKKMPGIEISSDGKITVNGEEVKKVRLDGKKFFDGDIEQATKNLPADMIEKVQVLDQKSDMAQLTGFEDGNTERIINLTTKPNRRKGIFGNIGAGIGMDINQDIRYDGNTSLNIMNGNSQTSVNAAANNLNNTRSTRGRGGWGGGANAGVTTSQNIGVNNNTTVNDKLQIGGDVTFNHADNLSNTETSRESYLAQTKYDDWANTNSTNDKYDYNMRLEAQLKVDTLNTFIFQPTLNYNTSDFTTNKLYSYLTDNDSTSWGNSNNFGNGNSLAGSLNVIYNHKFTSKPGRSLTANVNIGFSQSNNDSYNISDKYTPDSLTSVNQKALSKSNKFNYSMRVSYVEPLWNSKNMIETAVSFNSTNTSSTKDQYGFDTQNNDYSIYNSDYSNTFENIFYNESIELNYRYTDTNYKIMLGLNGQPSQTNNIRTYGNGLVSDTTYGVFNIAPTARLQYNFGKKKFARIDYRGKTNQPSITQMQPVKNNDDLMAETVGNPSLDPSFTHSLRLMYSSFNSDKFSSFNTFLTADATQDALVQNKIYDSTLKQYSQTVNSAKIPVNFMWNIMYTTPLIQKKLHFSTSTNTRYGSQYSYISKGIDIDDIDVSHLMLGDLSKTQSYSASEELSLTFSNDYLELGVRGNVGYSDMFNNLQNTETETWNWTGRGNMVIQFPYSFTLSSDISYSNRSGYADFDQSEIIWNASIDKTMFKNKGTFSLKANDILHQRLNIIQTIGDNYVQYSKYNTLPTYFILSFTYKLNKFGGNTNRGDFRYGPGMGRPDGGFRRDGGMF